MDIKKLSKSELKWIQDMEDLFAKKPTRLGLYTVGDCFLHVYDIRVHKNIGRLMDESSLDFGQVCEDLGANLGEIRTQAPIESVAG